VDEAAPRTVTIHVPGDDLGREAETSEEETPESPAQPAAKKRTRRGSRGGKNRRKHETATAAAVSENGGAPAEVAGPAEASQNGGPGEGPVEGQGEPEQEWGYVPMSEWADELD